MEDEDQLWCEFNLLAAAKGNWSDALTTIPRFANSAGSARSLMPGFSAKRIRNQLLASNPASI